jgi:hypothetical protein
MPDLTSMIGKNILLLSTVFSSMTKPLLKEVKLHGIEHGGIWIESDEATQNFLKSAGVSEIPKTLVWFLPWHKVEIILAAHDSPSALK